MPVHCHRHLGKPIEGAACERAGDVLCEHADAWRRPALAGGSPGGDDGESWDEDEDEEAFDEDEEGGEWGGGASRTPSFRSSEWDNAAAPSRRGACPAAAPSRPPCESARLRSSRGRRPCAAFIGSRPALVRL